LTRFGQAQVLSDSVTCLKNKQIDFLLKRNVVANGLQADTALYKKQVKTLAYQVGVQGQRILLDSLKMSNFNTEIVLYREGVEECSVKYAGAEKKIGLWKKIAAWELSAILIELLIIVVIVVVIL
jgi:hypothetical protein